MANDEFQEYRRQLIDINRKTQEELDKSLITLSTILLGLSFTLRQQLYISRQSISYQWIFTAEFFAFLVCIILVLISYWKSMDSTKSLIDAIDEGREDKLNTLYESSKVTAKINTWASVAFFTGVTALSIFAFLNFG